MPDLPALDVTYRERREEGKGGRGALSIKGSGGGKEKGAQEPAAVRGQSARQ